VENDDKKGVDVVRKLVPLLLITLLLAGCVGGTQVKIAELEGATYSTIITKILLGYY